MEIAAAGARNLGGPFPPGRPRLDDIDQGLADSYSHLTIRPGIRATHP